MNIKHDLTKWVYRRGWNLKVFATLCGVKRKTLENYLTGCQKIPPEKCLRIYELTGLVDFKKRYYRALEEQRERLIKKTLNPRLSLEERQKIYEKIRAIRFKLMTGTPIGGNYSEAENKNNRV